MESIADRRKAELLRKAQQIVASQQAAPQVPSPEGPHRGDDATDTATHAATSPRSYAASHGATRDATDMAAEIAARGALQARTRERMSRRAYTVYEWQDQLLGELARQLETDKSDVLRQIISAWLASQ
ncbi:MAG: hypothetical protein GX161_04505 [Firmicutes bacterium]|jgi:hypothetical protein|nr:hypothetical protein [Bacillota bacterium]